MLTLKAGCPGISALGIAYTLWERARTVVVLALVDGLRAMWPTDTRDTQVLLSFSAFF